MQLSRSLGCSWTPLVPKFPLLCQSKSTTLSSCYDIWSLIQLKQPPDLHRVVVLVCSWAIKMLYFFWENSLEEKSCNESEKFNMRYKDRHVWSSLLGREMFHGCSKFILKPNKTRWNEMKWNERMRDRTSLDRNFYSFLPFASLYCSYLLCSALLIISNLDGLLLML